LACGVGVRRFEDLVCWQLAHALKCEVIEFTATGPVSRDFRYCDQIRESSASAASNIAEAFGRYRRADAARFCQYAVASLQETLNHLIDGEDRKYLDRRLRSRLSNLARAALKATKNWMFYLQNRDDDRP